MAFTRDELSAYEKLPAAEVPDDADPFAAESSPIAKAVTDPVADPSTQPDPDAGQGVPGDGVTAQGDTEPAAPAGASAAPSSDTAPAAEDGATPPLRKGSAAERIQELVGERDDFKAYGEYAQEQIRNRDQIIQEMRAKQAAAPAASAAPNGTAPEAPDKPFPSMGDNDVSYDTDRFQEKVVAWATEKAEKEARRAAAAAATTGTTETPTQRAQRELGVFLTRTQKFADENKDFEDVTKTLPQLAAGAAKAVVLGEDGPAILYYLGKHKGEAVRIARLSNEEQLMELGALRSKLPKGIPTVLPPISTTPAPGASQTPAKQKTPSSAPPPPSRVAGGGTRTVPDITDPNLSMEEFARRHREGRVQQRTQARQARGLR